MITAQGKSSAHNCIRVMITGTAAEHLSGLLLSCICSDLSTQTRVYEQFPCTRETLRKEFKNRKRNDMFLDATKGEKRREPENKSTL